MPFPETITAKFWLRVTKTEDCWLWTGGSSKRKLYGRFYLDGGRHNRRMMGAHRFSWLLHRGDIPQGLMVLHRCDNPKCVNPDHLFLGNAKDNSQDMANKGRQWLQRAPRNVQLDSVNAMLAARGVRLAVS